VLFKPHFYLYLLAVLTFADKTACAAPLNHIMIIWGENTNESTADSQPYLASLASTYAQYTDYHAVTHPSQPNYMAFMCGTVTVTSDVGCAAEPDANLVDLLEAHSVGWCEYEESMVTPCADAYPYLSKHDFAVNFSSVKNDPVRLAKIKGFDATTSATYAPLLGENPPAVAFVTPNMINDGHDGGVDNFDTWLKPGGGFTFFQDMLASKYFTDGAIFITFDENSGLTGNQVYCVAVSSKAISGYDVASTFNHYSLLRTIEDNFSLGTLGANDDTADNMLAAFVPVKLSRFLAE
jgi:acid phosphatase